MKFSNFNTGEAVEKKKEQKRRGGEDNSFITIVFVVSNFELRHRQCTLLPLHRCYYDQG